MVFLSPYRGAHPFSLAEKFFRHKKTGSIAGIITRTRTRVVRKKVHFVQSVFGSFLLIFLSIVIFFYYYRHSYRAAVKHGDRLSRIEKTYIGKSHVGGNRGFFKLLCIFSPITIMFWGQILQSFPQVNGLSKLHERILPNYNIRLRFCN